MVKTSLAAFFHRDERNSESIKLILKYFTHHVTWISKNLSRYLPAYHLDSVKIHFAIFAKKNGSLLRTFIQNCRQCDFAKYELKFWM